MISIIPIVLGALAIAAGGYGVAKGAKGVSKISAAKEIGEAAQKLYESKKESSEKALKATQDIAEAYGDLQLGVKLTTIKRFVDLVDRIGQRASIKDMQFLQGLEGVTPQELENYKAATLDAQNFVSNGINATGAAYAAGQGTLGLVGLFGTASTGTAISGLSGAAAWNATLAWLGGGSLASGGGGMALGAWVLGGTTVGPALLIGGFVLGGEGEKAF